ncbi:MAG TPA: hypothetical protein VI636_22440 [Candidatus Angelobacter sp.]
MPEAWQLEVALVSVAQQMELAYPVSDPGSVVFEKLEERLACPVKLGLLWLAQRTVEG